MTAAVVVRQEQQHNVVPQRERRALPWALLAGLPAGAVSLIWAASAPLPMIDDWNFILDARGDGGFVWSGRPGEAVVHWLVFWVSGSHPVPPLLFLALLNIAVGALIWTLAERHWGARVATLSALGWAVLPNDGATRMWASCAPNLTAGVLALLAIVIADRATLSGRRLASVVVLAGAACLTYEGADALAAAAVALAVVHASRRARAVTGVAGACVLAGCTAWVATHTPKTGGVHLLANASRLVSTQFGIGLWPARLTVLGVVMFGVIAFALCVPVLGRARLPEESAIAAGAVGMVLGASVFMITGFPLSDAGLFDRGNTFTDFGTALVIGGALALAWRRRAVLGGVISASVLAVLAIGNVDSVQGFTRSAADARAVLRDVRALPGWPRAPIAIGPLPNHDGVAGFTAAYDINGALAVRYGVQVDARVTVTDGQAASLVGTEPVYRYCPSSRALVPWQKTC